MERKVKQEDKGNNYMETMKHRTAMFFAKRCFDVLVSLVFTCTLFPFIFIIVGIAIKLTSRGPILFCQKRSGKDGKEFTCLKFRTMVVNKEADIQQATNDDQRYTSIGKFLRKFSIDELPQFLNVLVGSMSVIGPRPHMVYHTEMYSATIPDYMRRLSVKPGVTGLSQIRGLRGSTPTTRDMANRVRIDLWYIDHISFGLDMYVFFKTICHFWE